VLTVVLVKVDNYRELKEAYPSYFSDISEFIESLEKVEENCERLKLL
jgi:putative GTP pyrophosphokinase